MSGVSRDICCCTVCTNFGCQCHTTPRTQCGESCFFFGLERGCRLAYYVCVPAVVRCAFQCSIVEVANETAATLYIRVQTTVINHSFDSDNPSVPSWSLGIVIPGSRIPRPGIPDVFLNPESRDWQIPNPGISGLKKKCI